MATDAASILKPIVRSRARELQVFSTCPSSLLTPDDYPNKVRDIARWSESAGCTGILIYTDNSLVDPWLVSQLIVDRTRTLSPLVAVQPLYMHPYAVAKIVTTVGFLYRRRVFLNMVAGGFKNDLAALGDATPHDSRYQRLVEYTQVIQLLLNSQNPVTFEGEFYRLKNLSLRPTLDPELRPGFLMSGSSEAGLAAARATGAVAVQYPEPPWECDAQKPAADGPRGIRIGIVTRPREEDAWSTAHARFPEDRRGQLTRQLATKISDSAWHHRLSQIGRECDPRDTYWLHPFENYQTNCPYLVGSYEHVTEYLSGYIGLGFRTFILDIPSSEEEFEHIGHVFQSAARSAAA
jgi:alkanesulfonate monooxygenase